MRPSVSTADHFALRAVSAPHLLRKLDRFRLPTQRSVTQRPGNTPVPHATQASGLEVASHRAYAPGDDLRYLDWNAYGRLDQRVVKTFRAEREAPVHLFIDTSASMGVPAADAKLEFAAALAAGLAYVALRHNNPVRAVALGSTTGAHVSPLVRHVQRVPELFAFLDAVEARGPTQLHAGIRAYLQTNRLPGLCIILSDFLVESAEYERALDALCERAHDVIAIRVIGPDERDGSLLPRHVRLYDVETGTERAVDLTADHRTRYRRAVEEHLDNLRRWCARRAIACSAVETGGGIEQCLLRDLPRAGILV
jgi:uncharacterized protein (DUF58 family)